jgi:hypothetical protein
MKDLKFITFVICEFLKPIGRELEAHSSGKDNKI